MSKKTYFQAFQESKEPDRVKAYKDSGSRQDGRKTPKILILLAPEAVGSCVIRTQLLAAEARFVQSET
jgi:hypothetical protein